MNNPYKQPTTLELLEIFPEALGIIPKKIKDWDEQIPHERIRQYCLHLMRSNYTEFEKFFFKEIYKFNLPKETKEAFDHIRRLKRMQNIIKIKREGKEQVIDVEQAKTVRVNDLFSFEKIKKIGKRFVAVCPFHKEKTPSFYIYESNTFHCFGCGANGDSISFIQRYNGLGFVDAVKYLNQF